MKKKEFKNLPDTDTPIDADNLNEMQSNIEESAVIVSATEPTTNEKVWIQKGNNLLNEEFRQGGWDNTTAATRVYSTQNPVIEAAEYTLSTNIDTSIYKVVVHVSPKPFPCANSTALIYNSDWQIVNEFTFTASKKGYLGIGLMRVDGTALTPEDIADFYFMVNQGATAKPYEAHIDKKIYCKNDNGVYEEICNITRLSDRITQLETSVASTQATSE